MMPGEIARERHVRGGGSNRISQYRKPDPATPLEGQV